MTTEEFNKKAQELHQKTPGKLELKSPLPLNTREDLSLLYTPGVGSICKAIANDKSKALQYTSKANSIAVISDGSAVLGLGNIGPEAALPVMEGKAIIFKKFADLNAWPIVIGTENIKDIIKTIKNISPGFAGINLEDFAAPKCFEIEAELQNLGIPVMHDDQHGTAIVAYAALLNACKVSDKDFEDLTVVVNGAGAAGIAITKMLTDFEGKIGKKVANVIICDSKGIIHRDRDDLNLYKRELIPYINTGNLQGTLEMALHQSDVFMGVSVAGALKPEWIKNMNEKPIIFAMANPIPEIYPNTAEKNGAFITATGRSDFPNQINNALVFPGIFKGAIQNRLPNINIEMKALAAHAIAKTIEPTQKNLLPNIFNIELVPNIVEAITSYAKSREVIFS
ncbi:NAD-dependent malic enzyme [Candidatus Peregrinibacteria bacterium]|nr:NAD-dependent malic enzyme [Candidatus Peregrinibacteria bacterium]